MSPTQVSNVVFTAGQIGLRPAQMTLAAKTEQPSLSLTHVQCVLTACHAHLGSTLCGVCYFTTEEAGWAARQCWTKVRQASLLFSLLQFALLYYCSPSVYYTLKNNKMRRSCMTCGHIVRGVLPSLSVVRRMLISHAAAVL